MKSIDIKSMLIGILGTALVMVLMGQSSFINKYETECVYVSVAEKVLCRSFDTSKGIGGSATKNDGANGVRTWIAGPSEFSQVDCVPLKDAKTGLLFSNSTMPFSVSCPSGRIVWRDPHVATGRSH